MKHSLRLLTTMLIFFSALVGYSQVDITASGGILTGTYPTLKEAFDAINAGTHTGVLSLKITGTVTETASAVLNASGSGTASYTAIQIEPAGNALVTGSIFGHLIDLNDADNVEIDGLNSTGNSLTISNSGTTSASTIRFYNDATNNTVTNCTLLGASSVFGVVYFGTGAVTGNDNNTISNNNIGPVTGAYPLNGIYSMGTSSVIDNNSISIINNNIYDFYSTSSASNGMNINSNNSAWTIESNSIYQTASRTYTTGSLHNGIFITSGVDYNISNNFIGGTSPHAAGTAYTMSGSVASAFYAINLAVGTTTPSSIQGNIITNFNISSTSANIFWMGIRLGGGNANIGTISGNIIGDGASNGAITTTTSTTGGATMGIYAASTGTYTIANNSIGSITANGSGATISASIYGIYLAGGTPTITSNTIGSTSTANSIVSATVSTSTTSAQAVIGISVTSAVTAACTVSNNTIANMTQAGTGTVHVIRGISYAGTGIGTVTGNIIHDLKGASANTTQAGGGVAVQGIIYTGGSSNCLISGNTIYTLSALNSGAVATTVAGIGYSNPTSGSIVGNKIYDLRNASTMTTITTPPHAIGILIRAVLGPTTFANNMISLGDGQSSNTQFSGFLNSFNTVGPVKIFYNTVYINGVVASGALPSFCFNRGNNSTTALLTTVSVLNNIFINERSGSTGKHYAIANNFGATASATGWVANASNYNVLNANPATIGYWSADQTFAGWQTTSASDVNSITAVSVNFQNTASANLHLNMGLSSTQLESGGIAVTEITNDYDGDIRPGPVPSVNGGGAAPDLGADEFDGVPLDLTGPVISYSPLVNTNSTSARTLAVTVTDPSGVPAAAPGYPTLYWKKTGDISYSSASPVSISGSVYTYNFGSGVSTGDIVSYYVVAQDNGAPSMSAFPAFGASGFTANPPAVSTPPSSPSTYLITQSPLSGDYTVGLAAFNLASGRNITFQQVTKKVMSEVYVEEANPIINGNQGISVKPKEKQLQNAYEPDFISEEPGTDAIVNQGRYTGNALPACSGEKQIVETEEISWIPMENGVIYDGPLYFNSVNNAQSATKAPTAGVYATITAAVADLNLRGVSGDTRFLLTDASYTTGETFPIIVNVLNENLPTVSSKVTIKPDNGVTAVISGVSPNGEIIRIFNTSYIIIDGSNTIGGTTRDLSITNTSATSPEVIDINSTGTSAVVGAELKNCRITNGSNGSTAIYIGDITGNAGYFNDINIANNNIQTAYIGIYNIAVPATGNGSGLTITGNDMNTSGASSIRLVGVYVQGVDGAVVSNNNIGAIANTTDASNLTGIWLATGTKNTTVSGNVINSISGTSTAPRGIAVSSGTTDVNINIEGNSLSGLSSSSTGTTIGITLFSGTSGVVVQKNSINDIKNSNTGGYSAIGIALGSTLTSANMVVANNQIWDVAGYGYSSLTTDNGYGINILSGGGYFVWYNSINLATDQTTGNPACLIIGSTVTPNSLDIRNNIFSIPTLVGTNRYSVLCNATNGVFSFMDYNDYYSSGTNLGYLNGVNTLDLLAWQTATGKDLNSISADPLFTSPSNLLPVTGSPVTGEAFPLTGLVNWDILGNPRSTVTPTIGAYELAPPTKTLSLTVFLEGLYAGGGLMNQAQGVSGAQFGAGIADKVSIELHESVSPFTAAYIYTDIDLLTDGTLSLNSIPGSITGTYFVVIKHRSSIETWSATPIDFSVASPIAFSFASAASQAFGNNLKLSGSDYLIWGGDATQDGIVDGSDMAAIDNASTATLQGYNPEDVNGDGIADGSDMAMIDNNSTATIQVIKP